MGCRSYLANGVAYDAAELGLLESYRYDHGHHEKKKSESVLLRISGSKSGKIGWFSGIVSDIFRDFFDNDFFSVKRIGVSARKNAGTLERVVK